MSIIYLSITSDQFFLGEAGGIPHCPADDVRLAKNGTYWRHILDRHPLRVIEIQRYRCAKCHVTYSALPYDLRPYTAAVWTLTWTIWMWHVEAHQPWSSIQDWLRRHEMILDLRTLQRWQARWRKGLPLILLALIQSIAQLWGNRVLELSERVLQGSLALQWRRLRRQVVEATAQRQHRDVRAGGLLGISVLRGWLPVTFFAGYG
jgi:hypothetical protein